MAKRRTREQKSSAKHDFQINWNDLNLTSGKKTRLVEASVNRQKNSASENLKNVKQINKKADYMEKDDVLRSIKIDLAKSLVISTLVIAIELVLYLTWV